MPTIFLALLLGVLPSFIWLYFWLQEDKLHPEPKLRILGAFLGGMLAVVVSLPLELFIQSLFTLTPTALIVWWAFIEEGAKFAAVRFTSLGKRFVDEPVDVLIYFITTALGFAALENSFFLLTPLYEGNLFDTISTGSLRFVGSTLLHTIASGAIGACLAFSFYKNNRVKKRLASLGLILAVFLHSVFNFLILYKAPDFPELLLGVFALVWVFIILLIFFFEKVKRITPRG